MSKGNFGLEWGGKEGGREGRREGGMEGGGEVGISGAFLSSSMNEWDRQSHSITVHMHRHSPCFYCSTILTTQPKPAIQHAHLRPLL